MITSAMLELCAGISEAKAYDEIAGQLSGQRNNTVLATMLTLGQRARQIPDAEADHWVAQGASTLVSSLLRPGDD